MTKKQKDFFDYLQKLKAQDIKFVQVALLEFFKYWENYDRQGVKDSMTVAMEATEAFVGLPVKVHLNQGVNHDRRVSTVDCKSNRNN